MRIDQYISELLYDFECVVLPGLGGFIASDRPAAINSINHNFNPPFRKLMFNKYLKDNDGLLVNHIAKAENLTFKQAGEKVDQFVENCHKDLQNNRVVVFENIGMLHFDNNQHFVFEQDTNVNYHSEAFGMSDFVSPVIKRATDKEKLKGMIFPPREGLSKPADRKGEKEAEKKRNAGIIAVISASVLLLFLGWGLMNSNQISAYWENQASFLQFIISGSHQGETGPVTMDLPDRPVTKKAIKKEPGKIMKKNEPATTETGSNTQKKPVLAGTGNTSTKETMLTGRPHTTTIADHTKNVTVVKPTEKYYYIIAGSFSEKENAVRLVENLKRHGFDAVMAGTSKSGMYRVAYMTVEGLSAASKKLVAVRSENNGDAWILRKPNQ